MPQNDGFVVLRIGDGCRQPCDDAVMKVSVDRAPQSRGCYSERMLVASHCGDFWDARRSIHDGDWSSGQEVAQAPCTRRNTNAHYLLIEGVLTNAVTTFAISPRICKRVSPLSPSSATAHQTQCRIQGGQIAREQPTGS